MLNQTFVEQRLLSLEQAVSDLQQTTEHQTNSESWLEKLIGSISDEAAFTEVLEYGRAFRQADRPTDEDDVSF